MLISSYLFFSKYLEFCQNYTNYKIKSKELLIERINNKKDNQSFKNFSFVKNDNSNLVIEVECEDITPKKNIKGLIR